MKKNFFLFIALAFIGIIQAQNVGIGTTTPVGTAKLEVSSTTQGFLPPRLTIKQRNAIASPPAGLMIWCRNCTEPGGEMQIFNGYKWTNMGGTVSPSPVVSICNQDWMITNLNVATYRNGDPIPKVTDPFTWINLETGAYCYYNNDSASYASKYGKIYNWYAINDPRGLVLEGWHVPSDEEWTTLETCLNNIAPTGNIGGKMKSTGFTSWASPNSGATNSSGFSGLAGGWRDYDGNFLEIGYSGHWWSSTQIVGGYAWGRFLKFNSGSIFRDNIYNLALAGYSVRVIRD